MINYKNLLLLFLLIPLLFNDKSSLVHGLTGCETLSSELCLASYPLCQTLILTSCCPGQTPLCLNIDTVIKYSTNKQRYVKNCLRNLQTGVFFELWGEMDEIPGYEILPIPNVTCKDLRCEDRGFDCVYAPATFCEYPISPCCSPVPSCTNFKKIKMIQGNPNCASKCPVGFRCKLINDEDTCVPTTCELIECPQGTVCKHLDGLDVVSCYKTIEKIDSISNDDAINEFEEVSNNSCVNITCPENYHCGSSPHSDTTCIPDFDRVILEQFDCGDCPESWVCKSLGWSGFCSEFNASYTNTPDSNCFDGSCLNFQFCNQTSGRCEFEKCTDTTCHHSMKCFQSHAGSPKVCSNYDVLPFLDLTPTVISEYSLFDFQFFGELPKFHRSNTTTTKQ